MTGTQGCSTSGRLDGNTLSIGPLVLTLPTSPFCSFSLSSFMSALERGQGQAANGPKGQPKSSGPLITNRQAAALTAALTAVNTTSADWKRTILGAIELGGLIGAAGNLLSPSGPGGCDRSTCERCCNVATSLPYIACGCHSMRNRKTRDGRAWGATMVGVGISSCVFHGSWGDFRTWGRRMDYWSIALASNMMTRAIFPKVPKAVTAAGLLATPFKPFLVSFVNSTAMELKFLQRAHKNPKLRNAQRLHSVCVALGLGAFALEEWQPEWPLVHSAWHCLSSTAVATINHLISDIEANEMQLKV